MGRAAASPSRSQPSSPGCVRLLLPPLLSLPFSLPPSLPLKLTLAPARPPAHPPAAPRPPLPSPAAPHLPRVARAHAPPLALGAPRAAVRRPLLCAVGRAQGGAAGARGRGRGRAGREREGAREGEVEAQGEGRVPRVVGVASARACRAVQGTTCISLCLARAVVSEPLALTLPHSRASYRANASRSLPRALRPPRPRLRPRPRPARARERKRHDSDLLGAAAHGELAPVRVPRQLVDLARVGVLGEEGAVLRVGGCGWVGAREEQVEEREGGGRGSVRCSAIERLLIMRCGPTARGTALHCRPAQTTRERARSAP